MAGQYRAHQPRRELLRFRREPGPRRHRLRAGEPGQEGVLLAAAEQGRRRMQIFELDGYLRLRSDFMHQFFMGQGYTTVDPGVLGATYGLPPFPVPLKRARANSRRPGIVSIEPPLS